MTLFCTICNLAFYILTDPFRRSELPTPYVCNGCRR